MTGLVGRYPFENYGVLAADELFGYALETQTLSLHPGFPPSTRRRPPRSTPSRSSCTSSRTSGSATTIALAEWSDVWLNEGHADLVRAPNTPTASSA